MKRRHSLNSVRDAAAADAEQSTGCSGGDANAAGDGVQALSKKQRSNSSQQSQSLSQQEQRFLIYNDAIQSAIEKSNATDADTASASVIASASDSCIKQQTGKSQASVGASTTTAAKDLLAIRKQVDKLTAQAKKFDGDVKVVHSLVSSQSAQTTEVTRSIQTQLQQMHNQIATLTTQLCFVLSFLNISSQSPQETAAAAASVAGDSAVDPGKSTSISCSVNKTTPAAAVDAVKSKHAAQTFKDVIRTAIDDDCRSRARRSKSIVVSGLETSSTCSDKDNFLRLCSREFKAQPRVTFCKRLGEQITGRIQPLLVALSTAEDAAWFVANAKLLRSSLNQTVKDSVFINANLTKEEAREAYEQRCRRRATAGQQAQQGRQHHQKTDTADVGEGRAATAADTSRAKAPAVSGRAAKESPSTGRQDGRNNENNKSASDGHRGSHNTAKPTAGNTGSGSGGGRGGGSTNVHASLSTTVSANNKSSKPAALSRCPMDTLPADSGTSTVDQQPPTTSSQHAAHALPSTATIVSGPPSVVAATPTAAAPVTAVGCNIQAPAFVPSQQTALNAEAAPAGRPTQ